MTMRSVVVIYLRNGCSFRLRPTDDTLKPPHASEIARYMSDDKAIEALANSTPQVVIKWSEVVAVEISEEPVDVPGQGPYA